MDNDFRFPIQLHGSPEERAMQLDGYLASALALIDRDKELARYVRYKIQRKNHGDKSRLEKFTMYPGPDDDTLKLLSTHSLYWYENPLYFWHSTPGMDYAFSTDPQEHISRIKMRLLCILLVEYRNKFGHHPENDQRINVICAAGGYTNREVNAKDALATMIERGGYYKNLEKHAGKGICFVLGTSLSETHWTKLSTKSGPKFNGVLERFDEISLREHTALYDELRDRVIDAKLEWFRYQNNVYLPEHSFSPPPVNYMAYPY